MSTPLSIILGLVGFVTVAFIVFTLFIRFTGQVDEYTAEAFKSVYEELFHLQWHFQMRNDDENAKKIGKIIDEIVKIEQNYNHESNA